MASGICFQNPVAGRMQLCLNSQGTVSCGVGVKKFHQYHQPLTAHFSPGRSISATTTSQGSTGTIPVSLHLHPQVSEHQPACECRCHVPATQQKTGPNTRWQWGCHDIHGTAIRTVTCDNTLPQGWNTEGPWALQDDYQWGPNAIICETLWTLYRTRMSDVGGTSSHSTQVHGKGDWWTPWRTHVHGQDDVPRSCTCVVAQNVQGMLELYWMATNEARPKIDPYTPMGIPWGLLTKCAYWLCGAIWGEDIPCHGRCLHQVAGNIGVDKRNNRGHHWWTAEHTTIN